MYTKQLENKVTYKRVSKCMAHTLNAAGILKPGKLEKLSGRKWIKKEG